MPLILAASPSLQKLSKSSPLRDSCPSARLSSLQSRLYSAASVQSRDTNPPRESFACGPYAVGHRARRSKPAQCSMGLPPRRIHIVAKMRPRSRPVQGPMRPTIRPQSTPCRWRFTHSQTRTISAKRAEVHQNLSRRPSPRGTATRRWPVKCRPGRHGVQTRGARAADHGIRR